MRNPTQWEAKTGKELNPNIINPLTFSQPADTMHAVSSVLGFVQCAISAMGEQDASVYDLSVNDVGEGLYKILETCRAALDYHAKGGAA